MSMFLSHKFLLILSVQRLGQPWKDFGSKHLDERRLVVRDVVNVDRFEAERSKLGQSADKLQRIR
jgi:hypothetical protein